MTTFDSDLASRGWALISEGAQMISLAYAAIEQPAAASVVPPSRPAAPADSDEPPPLKPQVDAGLGVCPTHGIPWVVKAAGVSKAGKRYSSFWKCNQRDGDEFCNERPQPIWIDAHPPVEGSAAA